MSITSRRDPDLANAASHRLEGLAEVLRQEALFASRHRFREMIDALPVAIYTTDAEGMITHFNPAAVELSGRVPVLGTDRWCTSWKLYHPDGQPMLHHECPMAITLKEGRMVRGTEAILERPDGTRIWLMPYPTPLHDASGRIVGGINMLVNITERKQVEAELTNARSVAEKANRAKTDFLSNMSHELRSPLNAILGFAQLLESDAVPQTANQKENTSQILQAGWYLLDLINEILDLALIESGKLQLALEPMALDEVLLECRAMIEPQAQKSGITVNFCHFDPACYIRADRTRVKQVLINLLSNAIKYNQPGGTVTVSCDLISAERIRINVADTGPGLEPEKLAQLFQPFNRLGQENSGEEGTGIGLVMTKRLVELMEGVIGVESTVGKGSVFRVELMRTAEPRFAAAEPDAPVHSPQDPSVRTLLYVEDNPANLKLVEQHIARRKNLSLLTAGDATVGIQLARQHLPEMILLDINLPGISGIEALRILHEDPLTQHIPVVAVSANAMPHDIHEGLEAGFFRYLTKPIKVEEFMAVLDAALDDARARPDSIHKKGVTP